MTAPVQLPLTREQVLERYAELRYPGKEWPSEGILDEPDLAAFEAVLAEAGLPLAYAEPTQEPQPEPQWPATLVVERHAAGAHILRDPDPSSDWYFAVSAPERLDEAAIAAEVARRWCRCEELEVEAAELQESRDLAVEELDRRKQRINALVAELAERTRERDESRADESAWSQAALRQCGELRAERDAARRGLSAAEGQVKRLRAERDAARLWQTEAQRVAEGLHAERDAARAEAAELRRRCEMGAQRGEVFARLWAHGTGRLLRGERPVAGSEGAGR